MGLTENGEMDMVRASSDYDRETKNACNPLQFELASASLRNAGRLVAPRRIYSKARVLAGSGRSPFWDPVRRVCILFSPCLFVGA